MFIRLSHWMMIFNNPFFDVKTNCFPPTWLKTLRNRPSPSVFQDPGRHSSRPRTQPQHSTNHHHFGTQKNHHFSPHQISTHPQGPRGLQTTALRDLPSGWVSIKATGTETRCTKVSDIKAQSTSKITDAGSLVFCGWKYGGLQTGEKWPQTFSSDDMIYYYHYYYIDINGLYVCRPYKINIDCKDLLLMIHSYHQASSDLKKVTKASANGLGKKKSEKLESIHPVSLWLKYKISTSLVLVFFIVVATQSVLLPAYHAYDILLPQCQPTSELSWQTWLQIQVGAKGMPGCWRTTRCNGKVMGGLSIWNQISTCSVSLIRWSLSESTFWGSHQWKLLMSLFPSAQA